MPECLNPNPLPDGDTQPDLDQWLSDGGRDATDHDDVPPIGAADPVAN